MQRFLPAVLLSFISAINCDIIFSEFSTEISQCKDICADSFFLLPKAYQSDEVCQRGCRFFNIIFLKDDHDVNVTKEECYSSCNEAYTEEPKKQSCLAGCNAMSKKKESEQSNIVVFIEQDPPKITLIEPDMELLESELLSDPLIQSQIEMGYNVAYKIPETKIRTMPIGSVAEISDKQQSGGDWLDCASRNSGIPKWVLLSAIASAVLVALWLSITSEKKVINEDEKAIVAEEECQAEALPEKDPKLLDEVLFSAPPKYSIETEKV